MNAKTTAILTYEDDRTAAALAEQHVQLTAALTARLIQSGFWTALAATVKGKKDA